MVISDGLTVRDPDTPRISPVTMKLIASVSTMGDMPSRAISAPFSIPISMASSRTSTITPATTSTESDPISDRNRAAK